MVINEIYAYKPDYAVHPGEYLEEVLEAREIKKKELSERLGISVKHLSQIINKQAMLTSEMAVQLERTLGVSANIWNHLNADYSLYAARIKASEKNKAYFEWVKEFPVKDLKKFGFLPPAKDPQLLLEKVLEFFGIPSPEQWTQYYGQKAVNFRKSNAFTDNQKHMVTWLRAGELLAAGIEAKSYNRDVFKDNLNKIRELTLLSPRDFEVELKRLCQDSGVVLVFLPEFEKTHISGATRWLTPEKALIVMSLRHKTNDHFWFTFFHEAGHILLHSKKEVFIDDPNGYQSKEEDEANQFASRLLIPENKYKAFVSEKSFTQAAIKDFAQKMRIHPGIVVGRLQHDGLIDFKFHHKLKERFELAIPDRGPK